MVDTPSQPRPSDDEIDLVDLIVKLWKEKWVIIISTFAITVIGALYAFTATPVYKISTQLTKPTSSELLVFNQTEFFSLTPNAIFSEFIDTLEASDHINSLIANQSELLESAIGLETNENTYNLLTQERSIDYPDTSKKINSLTPDVYTFEYNGINKQMLSKLMALDLDMAAKTTINNIDKRYKNTLLLNIKKLETDISLKQQAVDDKLAARKSLVLATRGDRLRRLEEAFKIAKALNLRSPSSLSRLSESNGSKKVEINAELNNNKDPLYLRGTRLLGAEINSLKSLEDDVYLDANILQLENQKLLLKNNRNLELLQTLISQSDIETKVSFYSKNFNAPTYPIKPKKTLIVAISILLGGLIGIFVAIGKITYRNYKKKANAT